MELLKFGKIASSIGQGLWTSLRDLLPIIVVVLFFQLFVFRRPLPEASKLCVGLGFVVVGLSVFIKGLNMGLFPLGEGMAHDFAKKGSVFWLVVFAFALGFGTTFAEPALIAIAEKASTLRVTDGSVEEMQAMQRSFAISLRTTVALSVGLSLAIGVVRIIQGWPLYYLIVIGYFLIMVVTPFAPSNIVALAYDSGGVTTSTITVPLTAALGIGLASSIRGRNPLLDGFGLIAIASLTPILFVLGFGILWP
jgi:uncharacterized membrane protein (DUF2068 family)